MATVNDFIKCPKCGKQMMGKAIPQRFGKEYFSHCCHEYFGVMELVKYWDYDAADFYPEEVVKPSFVHTPRVGWSTPGVGVPHYSEFDAGEPFWDSLAEYTDAWVMVGRMLVGITEYDDYQDLLYTEYDALQIGIQ